MGCRAGVREPPVVTIAMPVLNASRTISTAIHSVLQQTLHNWELLVIDDGSADGTESIVHGYRDPRIRLIRDGERRGVPERLNQAIRLARGEFVARMDADDICYPTRLEVQLGFLHRNPEVDLVGSWILVFRDRGRPLGKRVAPSDHASLFRLLRWVPIPHPTFFGRRQWFLQHPYLAGTRNFEDQFLLLSSHHESRFAVLPRVLLGYREPPLLLRKQARYRLSYVRAFPMLTDALGVRPASILVASQMGKLLMDSMLLLLGREDLLLQRRQVPLTGTELDEWEAVRRAVSYPHGTLG
jgi:glycosyltransferase involved in cell wall biosynthesis